MKTPQIYFDNAATTNLLPEAVKAIEAILYEAYGNPSAIHLLGRKTKVKILEAKASIASFLGVDKEEIFFTSGASEANRLAIQSAILHLGVKKVITSHIEHSSVFEILMAYREAGIIELNFVDLHENGQINLQHLRMLLHDTANVLVVLMHANNEISNLLPLNAVRKICRQHKALFHSDMAQTIAKFHIDLKKTGADFASCSAHKFHAAKGIGFLYVNTDNPALSPKAYDFIKEKEMQGAKNILGIAALERAIEFANKNLEDDMIYIREIKAYMIFRLTANFDSINFLGDSSEKGLYTILSVLFPLSNFPNSLLMNLDIHGIMASELGRKTRIGKYLKIPEDCIAIRFSFSKFNTKSDVDFCINVLRKYYKNNRKRSKIRN